MSHQMIRTPSACPEPFAVLPKPRTAALLFAVIIATGCQSDASSPPDLFSGEPWTVSGPDFKLGSVDDDPDYIFGPVYRLVQGPDGLLYSLHFGEATIRRWTADGRPAGSIGRAGEGPGEFERPINLGFFGDSLWVWDLDGYRVSYFDRKGDFIGRVSPKVDIGGPEGSPPRPSMPFRDGTFWGTEPAWSHAIATGELTETAITRMDSEGNTLAVIWTHPHEPRDGLALLNEDGFGGRFSSQPFGDGATSTIVDDGLVVLSRRAWTGEGEAVFTLTRIGLAGDTVFSIPVPYTPVRLPAERIDSAVLSITDRWYESMSQRQPGLAKASLEERVRDATYKPAYVPPLSTVMADGDGNIWLRRFDPVESDSGEALSEWWVLDAQGAPMARALIPTGLRIMHIADDLVWGVESDDLDVDYIVRYRLLRDE